MGIPINEKTRNASTGAVADRMGWSRHKLASLRIALTKTEFLATASLQRSRGGMLAVAAPVSRE
jgi:hypothetical protein